MVQPRPIAFMVMPFGERDIGPQKSGVPTTVNFDALWNHIYKPALEAEGYEAVRADAERGTFIVPEMLERIVLADLVLADITMRNANVYYEVGVRHALPKAAPCVLVSVADAEIAFDLRQVRHVPIKITRAKPTPKQICLAVEALRTAIAGAKAAKESTLQELWPNYPNLTEKDSKHFREAEEARKSFTARLDAAAALAGLDSGAALRTLAKVTLEQPHLTAEWAIEVVPRLRDLQPKQVGFTEVVAFISALPEPVRKHPYLLEQLALAQGKLGDFLSSTTTLRELIKTAGGSGERYGLLGGRYKELARRATDPVEQRKYLEKAIEAYENGMACDLNAYYPMCNLPRLYRKRTPPDEQAALDVATVTLVACERARKQNTADEWLRPTLLAAAFDAGNVAEALKLEREITRGELAEWKLDSCLSDCEDAVSLLPEGDAATALRQVLQRLRALVP